MLGGWAFGVWQQRKKERNTLTQSQSQQFNSMANVSKLIELTLTYSFL